LSQMHSTQKKWERLPTPLTTPSPSCYPDHIKILARLALLVVLILAMPAPVARAWPFNSKVTRENYEKIHNGMTKAQVEEILGKPNEMKTETGIQGLGEFESWIYWHGGTMVMIGFSKGYVSDKSWTEG